MCLNKGDREFIIRFPTSSAISFSSPVPRVTDWGFPISGHCQMSKCHYHQIYNLLMFCHFPMENPLISSLNQCQPSSNAYPFVHGCPIHRATCQIYVLSIIFFPLPLIMCPDHQTYTVFLFLFPIPFEEPLQ